MADVLRAVGLRDTAGRFSDGTTTSESGSGGFVAAEAFFLVRDAVSGNCE